MKKSEVLIKLLTLQTQIKLYHWQTESYARHKATDDFTTEIMELVDKFVEVYQGKYGRIKIDRNNCCINLDNITDQKITAFVKTMRKFLHDDLDKFLDSKNDTDLLNIRDEMLSDINQLLYLFTLK